MMKSVSMFEITKKWREHWDVRDFSNKMFFFLGCHSRSSGNRFIPRNQILLLFCINRDYWCAYFLLRVYFTLLILTPLLFVHITLTFSYHFHVRFSCQCHVNINVIFICPCYVNIFISFLYLFYLPTPC